MKPTFFLTTPIYYPNARPHVGSAYTTIVCDVLARYKRMCGYDVAFLTGTDEHGEKLERAAAAAGQSPHDFVAEKRELFVDLWKKLGMDVVKYPQSPAPDRLSLRFIYTDHPDHVTSVQRLLIRARENGYIYSHRYEGRYCVSDERYVSDNTDPVNCDICGRPAELISEDNYFFKLSAFQDRLLALYDQHPEFVKPDYRMNEVKSFVKSGLRDISVSRSRLKWGIPWPDDPHQVFYVWYDALTSYMTGIGYAQGENGSAEFHKYWRNQPPESEIVHMIGKDILRFHAVYWPAFIMAAYPDQPEMLPTTVFAHGWIYYEQDKMSKSKGNVVYPEPIVDALDSFGAPGNDALRYYLLREAPFGQDTSFSYEGLIQRYNSDLANGLGNLANRTLTMIGEYFEGQVPDRDSGFDDADKATSNLKARAMADMHDYLEWFDRYHISRAIELSWELISETNKYLVLHAPWSSFKLVRSSMIFSGIADGRNIVDPKSQQTWREIGSVLYTAADTLRIVAVLIYPIFPQSAERLWKQLGCEGELKEQRIDHLKWGELRPGTRVGKPEGIFPRLDKAAALAKLDELAEADRERGKPTVGALREAPLQASLAEADRNHHQPKEGLKSVQTDKMPEESPIPSPIAPPITPCTIAAPSLAPMSQISIEDFAKIEMRTGEIKTAEPIPGAKKLLKLTVDIGTEVRQVCAGIAEFYSPEKLIGMKVVVVTNLQPRKLRGVESNGMIVAASIGDQGRPVLVTFNEDVPNGARLK
jgi:methionyl-tRNA synthetase